MRRFLVPLGVGGLLLAAACSGGGEGGREVLITQLGDACSPASVSVRPGEKLKLVVKNESGKDYEIEGIEGTELEEVIVPDGRTRSMGYTVPRKVGVYKLKCYIPGDVTTIIELRAEGEPVSGNTESRATPAAKAPEQGQPGDADTVVKVQLIDYQIVPDSATVPSGKVRFEATNRSDSLVHELAVLRTKDDGSFQNLGEIEDLEAGAGGSITLDLPAGTYTLACLIAKGEAGSPVDHYKVGMHTKFEVGASVRGE